MVLVRAHNAAMLRVLVVDRNPADSICSAMRRFGDTAPWVEIDVALESLLFIDTVMTTTNYRILAYDEMSALRPSVHAAIDWALEGVPHLRPNAQRAPSHTPYDCPIRSVISRMAAQLRVSLLPSWGTWGTFRTNHYPLERHVVGLIASSEPPVHPFPWDPMPLETTDYGTWLGARTPNTVYHVLRNVSSVVRTLAMRESNGVSVRLLRVRGQRVGRSRRETELDAAFDHLLASHYHECLDATDAPAVWTATWRRWTRGVGPVALPPALQLPEPDACVGLSYSNPRTASLFANAFLRPYGSKYRFGDQTRQCARTLRLVESRHLVDASTAGPIVLTGDEFCDVAGRPNIVARQYDADSNRATPYLPLGVRYELDAWGGQLPIGTPRPYSMNFVGSLDTSPMRRVLASVLRRLPPRHDLRFQLPEHHVAHNGDQNDHLSPTDFQTVLTRSVFTLCPMGHNWETFRLWEAVDALSIPVLRRASVAQCPGSLDAVLNTNPPFVFVNEWSDLPDLVARTRQMSPADLGAQQRALRRWSHEWWRNVSQRVDAVVDALPVHTGP